MLKTKKRGDYKIITFAARGELLEWLLSKPRLSEFIRDVLIKQMEYEKYLLSPEWDKKRRMRLYFNKNNFLGKCEVCGSNEATQCHHITYARLYNEWVFDLAALCSSCHERIHKKND